MSLISNKQSLEQIEKIPVTKFCRRRLPVVMVEQLKMAENIKEAIEFIEQGHIRIGPERCTNAQIHVTRDMQDHVTWAEGSKIKRKVREFRDEADDFELGRN